jgi:hypothetical protein
MYRDEKGVEIAELKVGMIVQDREQRTGKVVKVLYHEDGSIATVCTVSQPEEAEE